MKTLRINWLGIATGSVNKMLRGVSKEVPTTTSGKE